MAHRINNLSDASEKVLIAAAKAGDHTAFEELVLRNERKIYNLGLKLLKNKEDAADLLQDTILQAYDSLSQFKEKAAFSTWLYRIATNFAFMRFRKKKLPVIPDTSEENPELSFLQNVPDPRESNNPIGHLKNQELKIRLEHAIGELPDLYKTVFILHDIEGYSAGEIAQMLDLSLSAVKSRIHRSRAFLREKVSETLPPGVQ